MRYLWMLEQWAVSNVSLRCIKLVPLPYCIIRPRRFLLAFHTGDLRVPYYGKRLPLRESEFRSETDQVRKVLPAIRSSQMQEVKTLWTWVTQDTPLGCHLHTYYRNDLYILIIILFTVLIISILLLLFDIYRAANSLTQKLD